MNNLTASTADTLASIFSDPSLELINFRVLEFVKSTNPFEMSLAQVLNFARSLTLATETIFFRVVEALVDVLAIYWNFGKLFILYISNDCHAHAYRNSIFKKVVAEKGNFEFDC